MSEKCWTEKQKKKNTRPGIYIYMFINPSKWSFSRNYHITYYNYTINKGNNKITELRTIFQRESQNSQVYKQTKSVNNRKTVMTLTWYRHFQRNGGLNQILRRQTSRFHYGSKIQNLARSKLQFKDVNIFKLCFSILTFEY